MTRAYRVEVTATAEADIADIWDFIAQDEPAAAIAFMLRLEGQTDTLERSPERCPRLPESPLLGDAYRHFIVGNYRAILKTVGDRVVLMRVLHGARLLDTRLLEGARGE